VPAFQPSDVIAILALVVALVGPITTWRIAKTQFSHEAELARRARNQARLETLYVDLLEYSNLIRDWADRTRPVMTVGKPLEPPTFPPEDARRRMEARIAVFGSAAIKRSIIPLGRVMGEFRALVWQLEFEEAHPSDDTGGDQSLALGRSEAAGTTGAGGRDWRDSQRRAHGVKDTAPAVVAGSAASGARRPGDRHPGGQIMPTARPRDRR
jgi:hypothetical protein